MKRKIEVKESTIEEAVKANNKIVEFYREDDENSFRERMSDKDQLILATYVDDDIAGYTLWYDKFGDGSLYCWMAGVAPEYRRLGLLSKMMDYGYEWAKGNGYKKIKIKTRNERREMLYFLVKNGYMFTNVERRENVDDNRIELEFNL